MVEFLLQHGGSNSPSNHVIALHCHIFHFGNLRQRGKDEKPLKPLFRVSVFNSNNRKMKQLRHRKEDFIFPFLF